MQCGITAGKRDDGEQVIKPLLVQSYSATFFINYMSRSQDMAITSPTFAGSDLGMDIRGPNRVSVLSIRVLVFRVYQNQLHSGYIKVRFGTGSGPVRVLLGSDRG